MKLDKTGSWEVTDNAIFKSQSIKIDKPDGKIIITSGNTILTIDKYRESYDIVNKKTTFASTKEFNIEPDEFIKIMLEKDQEEAKEKAIKTIRKMIWGFVLKFCQMDQYLFHKQQSDFYHKIEKGSVSLPFTKDNILQFFDNIFLQREKYFSPESPQENPSGSPHSPCRRCAAMPCSGSRRSTRVDMCSPGIQNASASG